MDLKVCVETKICMQNKFQAQKSKTSNSERSQFLHYAIIKIAESQLNKYIYKHSLKIIFVSQIKSL